jgi:uncharacterized protein
MSLETRIMEDLKVAMKAKDQASLRTIRSIKSAIQIIRTDGSGEEFTEEKEVKLLQRLVKQRQDSLEIFTTQGREDLAVNEREEIAIIQKYLPTQLTAEELRLAIQAIIKESGITEAKEMGKVIGLANQRLAGKTEGKLIAAMVKELLG